MLVIKEHPETASIQHHVRVLALLSVKSAHLQEINHLGHLRVDEHAVALLLEPE